MKRNINMKKVFTGVVTSLICSAVFTSCWDEISDKYLKPTATAPAITMTGGSIDSANVSITWKEPAVPTYTGMRVSCGGAEVTVNKGTTPTTTFTLLNPSQEYTIVLITLYSSGDEIESVRFKITTLASSSKTLRFIYTVADLQTIIPTGGYYYIQMNNLDLSGISNWSPIGPNGVNFAGIFDGNGHLISNLTINNTELGNAGLFGVLWNQSVLQNILLKDVNIHAGSVIGSLVGSLDSPASIINCDVSGQVSGTQCVGGLIGGCGGIVRNCSANVTVSGNSLVGGLVGYGEGTYINSRATGKVTGTGSGSMHLGGFMGGNEGGTYSNCYAMGSVTGEKNIGGFIGTAANGNPVAISDCYAKGNVYGTSEVGGFTGYFDVNGNNAIERCYSTGLVTGTAHIGGFLGFENLGSGTLTITNCYYDRMTSGYDAAGGSGSSWANYGTARTTNQMKTQGTFTGWDFTTTPIWSINSSINNGYPYLTAIVP